MSFPATRPALAALLLATIACTTADRPTRALAGDVGGTLVIAVPTSPGSLMPISVVNIQTKQITDLVYERLAEIGPELNTVGDAGFAPRLADRWSWSKDSLAITFHLDPNARWHDGRPVTAEDVRFTMDVHRDPASGSSSRGHLSNIDSVSIADSATVTVWYARRTPEQFYDAAGRLSILPSHLLRDVPRADLARSPLAQAPVGSGPFRHVRTEPNAFVELAADTGWHRGRARLDRVIFSVSPDPVAATTQLFTGNADFYEALRPENMAEFARNRDVVARLGPGSAYAFLQFNLRDPRDLARPHPLFADRAVRHAVSLLIDRDQLVATVWDSLAVRGVGPFPRMLATADTTIPSFDHAPDRAAALLDSLGWHDSDGDRVRDRNGRPLSFSLIVPSSSAPRVRMAVVLQEQLAQGGVRMEIERLEFNSFLSRMRERRFDVNMGEWQLSDGSAAGTRNTWGSHGAEQPNGLNYGHYASAAFDAQVDSGLAAFDMPSRRAYFARAYRQIAEDAPAVWLYERRNAFGIHRRVRTPPFRPASWWLDLHEWWIPEGERIERDRMAPASVVAR